MRRFLENLAYKMQIFMQGRYGRDEFSMVLTGIAVVLLLLSIIHPLRFLVWIALAVLVYSLYRTYSRNKRARTRELNGYLNIKNKIINRFKLVKSIFRDKDTHLYVKCPNCKTYIRISRPPRGKRIRVSCPKCRTTFEKRT